MKKIVFALFIITLIIFLIGGVILNNRIEWLNTLCVISSIITLGSVPFFALLSWILNKLK